MKFVILAATVGFVFGSTVDDVCTATGTECDDAAHYCDTASNSDSDDDTSTGKCALRATNGNTCTADIPCLAADYCKDNGGTLTCATKVVSGSTDPCVADGDCDDTIANAVCRAATCAGDKTCNVALSPADGEVGGCCELDANTPIVVADTDANYCTLATGQGIVTVKKDDAAECTVADQAWCKSGTCDPTTVGEQAGTCAASPTTTAAATTAAPAAAGTDGAACLDAVTAQTACDDGLTLDNGGDGTADTATTASPDDFCKGTTATALNTPNAAEAGKDGGAPREVIAAVAGDDRCSGTGSTATIVMSTEATPTETSCTCTAAVDSPAAIFYGMSMVTAAVAYLL